jgi:hypothetical protein
MMRNTETEPASLAPRLIESRIFTLRGLRVMLSSDLAGLYDVEPKVLVQAMKRNIERFPEDFVFQLTADELADLKSQSVTSSWGGSTTRRSVCVQRAGSCHALRCPSQPTGGTGQY